MSAVTIRRRSETVATARPYTVLCMKKLIAVSLAASTLAMAHAADYAPREFDFSELGTVEIVRQVPILDLLPDVFEHSIKPETVDEVVVRVDDGREVILREDDKQRFVAGERVRLKPGNHRPGVEHE